MSERQTDEEFVPSISQLSKIEIVDPLVLSGTQECEAVNGGEQANEQVCDELRPSIHNE